MYSFKVINTNFVTIRIGLQKIALNVIVRQNHILVPCFIDNIFFKYLFLNSNKLI